MEVINTMGPYLKAIVAFLAAVAGAVAPALEGGVSATEWVNVAILAVGAAAVFAGPNIPGARYTKGILAVLAAGLAVLNTVIVGGVTAGEWYQIAAAVIGAVSVVIVPNREKVTTR